MRRLLLPALLALSAPAAAEPLWGVNLSGGEFRGVEDGRLLPRPSELQAYHDAGFRLFRIPFKSRQLDVPAARGRLVALARKCVALRTPCIFDRHEYRWPPAAEQVAFWTRFAEAMPRDPELVQFDLMNEPRRFDSAETPNDWDQWAQDAQAIVTGLRRAGVRNRVWLEWPGHSASFRFDKGERAPRPCGSAACALAKLPGGTIRDPLGRTGLQAHRYFNKSGSGTDDQCVGPSTIATFARRARPFGMPVMLGESAFGSNRGVRPACEEVGRRAIAEMRAAPGFYGAAWWGGGRAWNPRYLHFTPPKPESRYVRMLLGR